jgi:hypothetical protein
MIHTDDEGNPVNEVQKEIDHTNDVLVEKERARKES